MRRWSSGLRVVKLAEKSCTTKPPIHAQWNEGGSVEEGAAVGARRPHQEFDPYQATVDQIANEDTETDNGKMEAEAVDCGVVARIVTGPHDANRQDPHLPMRYDTGRPRVVIRFKISQPRTASLPCPAGLRARRPSPMMDL